MAKFQVGQMVKFIGQEGCWCPPINTIGKILKINHCETDFLVDFPRESIVFLNRFPVNSHFWYKEDELEPIDEWNKNKNVEVHYLKRKWGWTMV